MQDTKIKKISGKTVFLCSVLGVVAVIIIAAVIVLTSVLGDVEGFGRNKNADTINIEIPKGSSVTSISSLLEENEVIKNGLYFKLYCRVNKLGSDFNYGSFNIKGNLSYKEIAEVLSGQTAFAETKTVVIPEGTGIYDYTKDVNHKDVTVPGIATLLSKAGVCTKEDFFEALDEVKLDSELLKNVNKQEAYCLLEGYLFPDTYEFYFYTAESYSYTSKECAKLAIERMIKRTEECFTEEMKDKAENMGYSVNEILTMASIIQMESGNSNSEMANVAAVFYNRLNSPNFSSLGSSPTCYYGSFYKGDDDRYDTYKIHGLPPGPLCSPGIDAIKAALEPSTNFGYYYFVTDKNGKFYYHKSLAEQSATINRLQQEGNWIYEYFN